MNGEVNEGRILSVVIPVYNVADFIRECLLSVVTQPGAAKALHVVIVIDGPTDASERVVSKFFEDHVECNALVITQQNQGLSAARNAGLAAVNTEYVTFLDGDDYWLPGYLEAVLPALASGEHDIIEYDALVVDEAGKARNVLRISAGPRNLPARIDRDDFLRVFKTYSWARIFRTPLIRSRPFPAGYRYEDTHTTPWYYYSARNIWSLGVPLIAYRQREGSILTRPSGDDIAGLNLAARAAAARYQETTDAYWSQIALRAFQQACARVIVLPFRTWPRATALARAGLDGRLGPVGGLARMLQVRFTLLYVALIYCKRMTIDKLAEVMGHMRFSKESEAYDKSGLPNRAGTSS